MEFTDVIPETRYFFLVENNIIYTQLQIHNLNYKMAVYKQLRLSNKTPNLLRICNSKNNM